MRLASLMLVAMFSYMPDASLGASALELVFKYTTRYGPGDLSCADRKGRVKRNKCRGVSKTWYEKNRQVCSRGRTTAAFPSTLIRHCSLDLTLADYPVTTLYAKPHVIPRRDRGRLRCIRMLYKISSYTASFCSPCERRP